MKHERGARRPVIDMAIGVVIGSLSLVACSSPETIGPAGEVELPTACEGEICDDGRECEWGVCVGTENELGTFDDVDGAVRSIVRRACARAHGECNDICDNPFVECYRNVDTCTEAWAQDLLADFDNPVLDPTLAGNCAAQVDTASCRDLSPNTLECEFAVVESCPDDDDEYGSPYSPFRPARVEANGTLHVRLCAFIREFYAVELTAGERLSAVVVDETNLELSLFRLISNSRGEAVLEMVDYVHVEGRPTAPVPDTGVYLLEVRNGFASGRHELALSTSVAP